MEEILKRIEGELERMKQELQFRTLNEVGDRVDLASNDYLGLALSHQKAYSRSSGSGGSRLISGTHRVHTEVESMLANEQGTGAALLFATGYMANLGLLSALPQKQDTVYYDELAHASIRDALRLTAARSVKFRHNDVDDLRSKLSRERSSFRSAFIVTESVFSMDGDEAPLQHLADIAEEFSAGLIVDEAHGFGVFGKGLVYRLGLQQKVLATVLTCSKAWGLHGGVVLADQRIIDLLINRSRPFIYSTSLPPSAVAAIGEHYQMIISDGGLERQWVDRLAFFKHHLNKDVAARLLRSRTPIQSLIVPGNEEVLDLAKYLNEHGLDVKAIRTPTVPPKTERIRIIIHAFNTDEELMRLTTALNNYWK